MRIRMCIMTGLLLLAVLLLIPSIAFADASATRTLPAEAVAPGEQFTVHMTTDLQNGSIKEFLPAGFTFAGPDSISAECEMFCGSETGDTVVNLAYLGAIPGQCTPGTFSYDVIASVTPGTYNITGEVKDSDLGGVINPVGGDTQVTVEGEVPAEDVVINEFICNPSTGNECVELYNKEAAAVDLTGWTIEDGTVNPDGLDGLNIPANGYLALEQGTDFSFQLNNAGDIIVLKKGATEVDKVAYGSWNDGNTADNAPAPGSGESAGRYPNGADTNVDNVDFRIFEEPTCGAANELTAEGVDAIRTLPAVVAPGEQFEVSVYCTGWFMGRVIETLPAGFDYVPGSLTGNVGTSTYVGNELGFAFTQLALPGELGFPGTITYDVTASATPGIYQFVGEASGAVVPLVEPGTEVNVSVTGDDTVSVQEAGTIPNVLFAQANYNVNEGNAVVVEVILSKAGTQTITVEYDTVNGTAVAPGDYASVSGMLTFAPGDVSETFEIDTTDDVIFEGAEVLTAYLSDPTNANLGVPNVTTITINDVPPGQIWDCPAGDVVLIAPYPNRNRPEPLAPVNCDSIQSDVAWFIIAWLEDEETEQWRYYNSQLAGIPGVNDLNQLQPGEFYNVVVAEPGGHLWWQ